MSLPQSVETFLKLLSGAASSCALVSRGLFLAQRPAANDDEIIDNATAEARSRYTPLVLTAIKLIAQPALAWWLAAKMFALPPLAVDMAVLLAALPTGTGPYMLAEFYRREARITSQTILLSTLGSLVTLSALLYVVHAPG